MGACVSRQHTVKTVASPLRPSLAESRAPTSPADLPRDARLTTAVDLPGRAKDEDDHALFQHEAMTPEVFSARSSTDGENSITEGDTQASAVYQTSKEPATFKSSETSMQPGSFPDKFHDASDVFESLDFPLLNSENNPLPEISSENDKTQPPSCTTFTHRETMNEESMEENEQELLQAVVTLQRIRTTSSAEETKSEAAEHDHLIQHEAEKSAEVSTLLVKRSNTSVESIVESNTTEQESRMVMGKEALLQMKERGLTEPELITDNPIKEDPKIYGLSTDSRISETPVKTDKPTLVEQPVLVEESFEERDTNPTTRKDAKTVEQTASVEEWKKGSEIAATIVAATGETLAIRGSEKSLDRSASSIEKQHKELETDLAINATTKTDQTLAMVDVAQPAPTEASEKGFQCEQPSSEEEASASLKLQITRASSVDNGAFQENNEDSHEAIDEIDPNTQQDINDDQFKENHEGQAKDDQSRENQEGRASVVPGQAADVKQIIDSKDLCETKGDSSQAATPKPQIEFQRPDQGKGIPEKAPPTNNSVQLGINLNELSTGLEISKILVTGNDLSAVDQTTSFENHQGEPDTAGSSLANELEQAETFATREYCKTLKQTASIIEHQEESETADGTSNKLEPTHALATRTNAQNIEQPVSLEEKHQVLETIPATNMAIETVEPRTSWNDGKEVEADPATTVAIETAETLVTIDNSKTADAMAPLEEQCEESEKDATTNSTTKTIGSLAISKDAQSQDPTAAKEEWLDKVDVAPATNAVTESAETLTTRENAQISSPKAVSQEKQKQSDTSTAADAATVSVLGSNAVKKKINVVHPESGNVENSKEPEHRDSSDQQSVSFPALQEWREKSNTAQASQIASETVWKLTVPSNAQYKESESTLATDATTDEDIVLINRVADSLNIVEFERSNDEDAEEPGCKNLDQQQTVLSPYLDERREKIDTVAIANATEEQQEESNTAPVVDGATEPDIAPSDAVVKDAQAMELEHANVGYIEKQESTYVDQQLAISSSNVTEQEEEFDMVQTTKTAAEIAKPRDTKDDARIATQTVPSEEKHEESGTIPATTSTTEVGVVPIQWVRDTTVRSTEQYKESETTPDTDATSTDAVLVNMVEKGVNIVGLESNNDKSTEEPESMDVDQQRTVSSPSLDEQRKKSDTSGATKANEEQQEESTMEHDVAPLDAITKDAQAVKLEGTNAVNVEKCKGTCIDQQQTVSPPALKERAEQLDIIHTTSTAVEIDETIATKDDAQVANPVVQSEKQHEESSTIPATDSTEEADVTPIKTVTDPTVPRNEQHKEPETTPATDAAADTNIVLTSTVAKSASSDDENVEKPESRNVEQQQKRLFPSLHEQCEKSDTATDTSATVKQQHGSDKTPAIDATTVPDVAPIDGVTKDAQAVELQSTNAENVEKQESTYIDQQQALFSSALKEPQEELDMVQTTHAAAEIAGPFVTKDDAQIANPIVPSEEQHKESGRAAAAASTTESSSVPVNAGMDPKVPPKGQHNESKTSPANDAMTNTDVVLISTVTDGINIVDLESSNDENIEKPKSMIVDQQQTTPSPSLEEQCEKSDTAPTTSATEEWQKKDDVTTPAVDATTKPGVASFDVVTKDAKAAELGSPNVENVEKEESTYIEQQQEILSSALKELPMPSEEPEESGTAPITSSTTEADDAPISAVTDPIVPRNEQHKESETTPATDATADLAVVVINTVREKVAIVGFEAYNDENLEEPENTDFDQQQAISSPSLDEQGERPGTAPATSASEERQEGSNTTSTIDATTKPNVAPIDTNINDGQDVELESTSVENVEKPESADVEQQQKSLFPSLDEQCEKSDTAPDTSATEEHQQGSNETSAIGATTIPDVAPTDGITKDAQAVELQGTNAENVEKQESTYSDEQEALFSPALKEPQEVDIVQTTHAAEEIARLFVTKDDAQIANPRVPSKEQHEELSTTPATVSTTEANVVPINVVTGPTVQQKKQHKESETTSAADATTDVHHVFIDTVTEGANFVEFESGTNENVKETESTYVDQQKTISFPYLDEQCENSETAPASTDTEEWQEESNTTPAIDAKTEPDVAPTDAVTKDTKAVEHESINGENGETPESTYIDQQQAVSSPALREQQEQFNIVQTASTAAEIAESLATKKQIANTTVLPEEPHDKAGRAPATASTESSVVTVNAETDPTVPPNGQHNESKTTKVTNGMTDTDVVLISTLTEGINIVGLESNNDENIEEPRSMDVDQQKITSSTSLDEQYEKSGTAPAISATEEHQEKDDATTPVVDETTEPDVVSFVAVTKDAKPAEFESANAENIEKRENTYIDQQQAILSPALKELQEEFDIVQTASVAAVSAETLATKGDAWRASSPMPSEEHEESGATPITSLKTEADGVLISAVTDPIVPWNEEHKESETTPATDAATDMAAVLINTVRESSAIVGFGACDDRNLEGTENTVFDQQQTISSPSLDEQCERSGTAPATSASEEEQESNTTPAIDAKTKPNVAPIDANTKDEQNVELESTSVENVEKKESTYTDEQQAASSPALNELQEEFEIAQTTSASAAISEALATMDDAHMANPTIPFEKQHEESGTTSATTSMVTKNVEVVELERGSVKNVEEPHSAVVDQKQSVSFPALEEQCKNSGMAPATSIATKIAEIPPTGTYAHIAELIQPMEEWLEQSDTTPVTDAITEANYAPIGVETEIVKAVELESGYDQNVGEPKSTNNHVVRTVLTPAVEKQQEDSDTTPITDAITEADDIPIPTVTEELKTSELGSKNAEEIEELKGTYDNLDVTVLSTTVEGQHKESDIPQPTDAVAENVGLIPSGNDASMADSTLTTEIQHEESDTSPAMDTRREADVVPTNITIDGVQFVKLKSSTIEYPGKSKSVDIEQQAKVSLLAFEEHLKESDTTPATSAATEIAETFPKRNTAQMVDPIMPTKERYEGPISNQVTNATAKTNIDTVTEDVQVVELQGNNPENVEDPESAYVDKKQRASSLTLEEKHEDSETAKAIDAAKIVAEILSTDDDVQIPDPTVPTEEQQGDSSTTPAINTTIKADSALTKNVKAVEFESGDAENAEPKSTGNEQRKTASSPVFDDTNTTPVSDIMIETDVPVYLVTRDVNVVELESTNAKNEEEPQNAHIDQYQKIFPPNFEELHEKSQTSPSTSATSKLAKDLPTRDDVGMAERTVPTEEQHKEFETTPTTTGIGNVVVDTVILDEQVEHKSGDSENIEGPCSADIDKKQEAWVPALEEQSKEIGTDPAINAATTMTNTLPTRDDQQGIDPTVSTTEQYEASIIIPASDPPITTVVSVSTSTEHVKAVEGEKSHTKNAEESENAGIDQRQAISSAALEVKHKESVTVTETPTKTARTLSPTDNAQKSDPTVQIEEHHEESDTTQAADAPTAMAEVAKLVEPESYNPENVEQSESADNNQQPEVSHLELEEQHEESHTSPTANEETEIAEVFPVRNDAQVADPTVSTEELHEELKSNQVTNAVIETNIDTKPEDTQLTELQSNNSEKVEDTESADIKQGQSVSSLTLKEKHEESETAHDTNAATEIVEILSMGNDAPKANTTKEQEEESDTTLTTDATTEGDVCINAVTQVLEVLEFESANAENIKEAESADLNREQTVSSLALEEQHEESRISPAADAATEIAEMLPIRNDSQTVNTRVSTDRSHEESDSNKDVDTTTEANIDAVTADTQVVEFECDNSDNVDDQVRADTNQKHSFSSPELERKHEESEAAQTPNTTKEIFEIIPTRNDAQMESPTLPTEEQQKKSDMTPAVDATVEADDINNNAVTLAIKAVEIENGDTENAEEHQSTRINQQKTFLSLAFGKRHEESEKTPTVGATTETHILINPVTNNIEVVEFEDKANIEGEKQSTDINQHETVSAQALDKRHEESDTAPTTSTVTKVIKTLPARSDAETADLTVPIEEQHQEFGTTPASDAATEADNGTIDTEKQKSKFVEVKASNAENAEWPESADIDKRRSVLYQTLEGQEEGSHTDPANNTATEIVNALPARDAQQITDSKVSMTEQHGESNTIPAPDATVEAEKLLDAAAEDVRVVELEASKAVKVKEPENSGIEQQHEESSPALKKQHAESIQLPATDAIRQTAETLLREQNTEVANLRIPAQHRGKTDTTLTIDPTTERDVVPINAAKVQNAEVADPEVPTEEYNGQLNIIPAIDATEKEDVVTIDAVTEDIKAVELDSRSVQNAENPEITDIKQQDIVSSLASEEQHEELFMSPAANAAKEIAEILPTENDTRKADPTAPAALHEESQTTPAIDTTTGVDVLSVNEMAEDVKVVELESENVRNNDRQSKDANEQQTVFSLALEEPHDELNPSVATNAYTGIIESKSINIVERQQAVSSQTLEQKLEQLDMALANNAATGTAKTPLSMDDTYVIDTTVPAEESDTTLTTDGGEVDVPPSSTVTEITKVWQVNWRDTENVNENAYTGQQQTVWSPTPEDFEKSYKTPKTNAAIETAVPLFTRDDAQTPVSTKEQHEQSDAIQAISATDVDVPVFSTIKDDIKAVELQSSNAGNVEESDSTEPKQQVALLLASEEQQEGSDTGLAINASTETAEILHARDNAKPVEPTISTEQLCKESDITVSPNATIDIDADIVAVNAVTKGTDFLGLKCSNVENTRDQESMDNEKQIILSPPLDAYREEKEFEQHKECEASNEVSLNEPYAIAELHHNAIKVADAEVNVMGFPEIKDHNIANEEEEGIAAQTTK